MNGKRMPTPRSKPSITTYIIKPKPTISAQRRGRSMPISRDLFLFKGFDCKIDIVGSRREWPCRTQRLPAPVRPTPSFRFVRPLSDQLQHVADACAEHGEVHADEDDQSYRKGQDRMVRHGIFRPQHAVDDPGL